MATPIMIQLPVNPVIDKTGFRTADSTSPLCQQLCSKVILNLAEALTPVVMKALRDTYAIDHDVGLNPRGKADRIRSRKNAAATEIDAVVATSEKSLDGLETSIRRAMQTELPRPRFDGEIFALTAHQVQNLLLQIPAEQRDLEIMHAAREGDTFTLLTIELAQPLFRRLLRLRPGTFDEAKALCLRNLDADAYQKLDALAEARMLVRYDRELAVRLVERGEPALWMLEQGKQAGSEVAYLQEGIA